MQLSEIIKSYILQTDTDFAILINGKWGSGKTYYLKNEIAKVARSLPYQIDARDTKPHEIVYVSLYGITTADELQKRLFLEVNPSLKTKAGRVTSTLISKGLQYIGLEASDKDQKELLNIFGGIPKYKILVFDDLERLATETLNEVLGFINTYTEHQKLKVIVIADEEKIKEKLPDYDSIKEKLIRFTYLYNPSLAEVFSSFVPRYQNVDYRTFLTARAQNICSLFEKGEHRNLRTLRFVLDLFEHVFYGVKSDAGIAVSTADAILDRYLHFFVTYSIAYKDGATSEQLNSLEDLSSEVDNPLDKSWINLFVENLEGTVVGQEQEADFKEQFEKKFIDSEKSDFQYFSFLAHYIHSGDLSITDLKRESREIQEKLNALVQKPEYIALEKLKNCLTLHDEDFGPLVREIYGYVSAGIYRLEFYPIIFQNLQNCSLNGIDNLIVDRSTVDLFKEGMTKSLSHSKHKQSITNNIYIQQEGVELMEEIKAFASELNESLLVRGDAEVAAKLFTLLRSRQLNELAALMQGEDVQSKPVFQEKHIEPAAFLAEFLTLSNIQKTEVLDIFTQFSHRFINYGYGLKEELPFFTKLLALVDDEIARSNGNYRLSTAILFKLKYFLQPTVERLKKLSQNDFS